ncbi:MAG: ABC transporter substrate-binding protein [Candidatus Scatomorpha sp.]|jgi:iron complex transport system substrate-binding protein
MFKKTAAFLLAAAVALSLCACGQSPAQETPETTETGTETRTITDALGREVTVPAAVEKIIPLGNTPRMITYLGLADKVVGIGDCEIAESPLQAYAYVNRELWKDLPIVGSDSMGETSYYPEELIQAVPDVIVCTYGLDTVQDIERQTGLPVVAVTDASLFTPEYEDSLRILGEVGGVSERAEAVVEFINNCIADLRARTENIPDDDKPSILAAAATFKGSHGIEGVYSNYAVFDVISVNDVTRGMTDTGVAGGLLVDKEQILAWDADLIFLDYSGVELVRQDMAENPDFYTQLKAFRNGDVYQCPNSTWHWSNVEIPLVSAYYMGSLLYPKAFADVDFEAKAAEIFEFFLGQPDFLNTLAEAGAGYMKLDLEG